MPRSFFRDTLKNGGKKTAAGETDSEKLDRILRETMAKASKKTAASKPSADDGNNSPDADAAQIDEKKRAAEMMEKISGNRTSHCAPVRNGEDSLVVPDEVTGITKAGIYYADSELYKVAILRSVIAKARTKNSRGKDWDCVGMHAGMSRDWVAKKMLEIGKPITDLGKINPIKPDDGVVSMKLLGTWSNSQRVTAEVVADGSIEFVTVRDSRDMHLGDIFDCRKYGNTLYMTDDLNNFRYS